MEIKQYSVYWVNLDPVIGSEVSKTCPCVVVSPNEMNKYLKTVIIALLTYTIQQYPTRVLCAINGDIGMVMLGKLKTVDKQRLSGFMATLCEAETIKIKAVINEMLC